MTKLRLYAGTINHHPDEDGYRNYHLDVSPRGVWDRDLNMSVLPDFVADIAVLADFRNDTFDEIVASHVLEHLPLMRAEQALAEFLRVLKPDGILDIEVPDIARVIAAYQAGELDHDGLVQWCYGEQLANHEPGDSHRYAWTENLLHIALTATGFVGLEPLDAGHACRFRAWKPAA